MYACGNPKTKKELKQWIAEGRKVGIFQPGPFGGNEPQDGNVCIEGPHFPKPHTWYASCKIANGVIVSVK